MNEAEARIKALMYLHRTSANPPPRYQAGEAGPPIPGVGQYTRRRLADYNAAHQLTHDEAINPHKDYGPRAHPRRPGPSRKTRQKRISRRNDAYYANPGPQIN